jgi:hypothetical protein
MKPTKIVIHCSDSEFGTIDDIDDWHREFGFRRSAKRVQVGEPAHCGYQFVICNGYPDSMDLPKLEHADGAIQIGRDEDEEGAHAFGSNDSIGVCLIGKPGKFTPNQIYAMRGLVASLALRHGIQVQDIIGHFETPHEQAKTNGRKTCPGLDMKAVRTSIAEVISALVRVVQ